MEQSARPWECRCKRHEIHKLNASAWLCGAVSDVTESSEWYSGERDGAAAKKKKKPKCRTTRRRRRYQDKTDFLKPLFIQSRHWHLSRGKIQVNGLTGRSSLRCYRPVIPPGVTPKEHMQILEENGYKIVKQHRCGNAFEIQPSD